MEKFIVTILQTTWVLAFWLSASWMGTLDSTRDLANTIHQPNTVTKLVRSVGTSLSHPNYPVN